MQERILSNYEEGKPITLRGVSVRPEEIIRITIAGTYSEVHNSNPRRRLREFLRDVDAKDATDSLIIGPPGWKADQNAKSNYNDLAFHQLFDYMVTNERIREVSRQRFLDGYYAEAVVEAAKCLNSATKEKSGRTSIDGTDLMRTVFSAKSPVLKLNAFKTPSERNEQQGYMDIFAGTMMGIRNPRVHEPDYTDAPQVALELLVLANHLMRKLDSAIKSEPETAQ